LHSKKKHKDILKQIKTIAVWTIWTLAGLYLSIIILLKIPAIQGWTGSALSGMIENKIGSKAEIGKVEIGLFNRIVADNVRIYDQAGRQMLRASRLAVKVDLLPLMHGSVSISSAQMFGMDASLYRQTEDAPANFQFVIDALSSKDSAEKTPLDLRIQSLVIRNGAVRYDQYDKPRTPGRFNAAHIDIKDISMHIKLYSLTDDSLSIYAKKLSLKETSGLELKNLSFSAKADKNGATISDLLIKLPQTSLHIAEATAAYKTVNGGIDMNTIKFNVKLKESEITPGDLKCFDESLKSLEYKIKLTTDLSGTGNSITINNLSAHSDKGEISVSGNGNIQGLGNAPRWNVHLRDFHINGKGIKLPARYMNGKGTAVADVMKRVEEIRFKGDLSGHWDFIACRGNIRTGAGDASLDVSLNGKDFNAEISTKGIDLQRLSGNETLGMVSAAIKASGSTAKGKKPIPIEFITAKGEIERFDYNSYSYRNISIDGTYRSGAFDGQLSINDPNGKAGIKGHIDITGIPAARLTAEVKDFNPHALQLTDKTGNNTFSFLMKADISGKTLETAEGSISVEDFSMWDGKTRNRMNALTVNAGTKGGEKFINVNSDFGNAGISGRYDYGSMMRSITNIIGSKLPTLPGLPGTAYAGNNRFDVDMHINDLGWLGSILDIPLELHSPLDLNGTIDDRLCMVDMTIDAPGFSYGGNTFAGTYARIVTQDDTLHTTVRTDKTDDGKHRLSIDADMKAAGDKLAANVVWNINNKSSLSGTLNTVTDFNKTFNGKTIVHTAVGKSEMTIDKTRLDIQPSEITYFDNTLTINNFKVNNNSQYLTINGAVTKNESDSLTIDMQNIDVGYILDLVNFHSVEFSGYASGRASVKSLFSTPEASAEIKVDKFLFENGRMGTLYANVGYNANGKQIDINAVADDGPDAQTQINGYVSPEMNYIDLGIQAKGTRLEFLENFCGSFMHNVNARGNGFCRVFGDLKCVNLEGKMTADGTIDIKPLNTTYTLRHDTITMIPDEIMFINDTIYDVYGHRGTVNGALHHKHLTRLTFDIGVEADNLLAYDTHGYNGDTFYGTVLATGNCYIKGRPGEITMDIEATPEAGSFIEYNAASRESIAGTEFIRWRDMTPHNGIAEKEDSAGMAVQDTATARERAGGHQQAITFPEISSDVKLNFLINATPDFTLRVLMDEQTGDYIALNGSGVIRADYFNKGAFEMFGNYLVEDGVYKLTIQNIIKKDFRFQQGSSIAFGGDPFGASLNLKGIYTLNAVSLSDLQIGRSFKSNNIKVNCLMDITGTAGQPSVTFDLDLPTLNADAQQMVRSVINSEEDMNQQVLYLLAVGRFYTQGNNNAAQEDANAQSQTSLAMQSLLSGTISQQINTVLSNVVKSSNWNFGANISTGNEGWNNAEYEGLLSGRLLNNRLLINGQFGYRDRVNTTEGSNFIGDFDIRYLLFPSGNLAIKVYNQTNDRYFTRNSLTTQGIGLIMKKDFTRLSDIFGRKKKGNKEKKSKGKGK